jgi:23S rRNA pseudouridine1911/1915/1917 synthase
MRLDQVLATVFSEYSRSRLQQWIRDGFVDVDGEQLRAKDKVLAGQRVCVQTREIEQGEWEAEALPLAIVYEDEYILVINKPVGLVVHPAAGNYSGTLLNALLHHAPTLINVPRAGIVHRLDKDTSGLLVIAKDLTSHKHLVEQLQARTVAREYLAVVQGVMTAGGTVDAPIGRHPVQRKKMAVVENGKPAITHYRVEERYRAHSLIKVKLETGRTHQIRVHMAYIHYPLVGDSTYAGRLKIPAGCTEALRDALRNFPRQALHAFRLAITHPVTQASLAWEAPIPDDLQTLIRILQDDARLAHAG